MDKHIYNTTSSGDTIEVGEQLGRRLKKGDSVLLYGEMGAGKTHFTKGLALGLGIKSEITSPTFAIVNEYEENNAKLFHFDLFRLKDFEDLYAIGFFDYLNRGVIVCEWSENVSELEDEFEKYYKVEIKKVSENEREITVKEQKC